MVNFNGDLLPDSSHFLNQQNRGLHFGDALTEYLRYSGTDFLFWEDCYFRLMAAMRQLRMEIPMDFTLEFLEQEMRKTLQASGLETTPARVELLVFREGGSGLLPQTQEVSFVMEVQPLEEASFTVGQAPFIADLFRDYYLQADALARLPHNNRLVQVLASIYAAENGLHTCLLLNHRKEMAEGLHGTLFVRKGKLLKTPPLDSGCQAGVLRGHLLKQDWSESPYGLTEEAVSPFELQQADELFTVDMIHGVQPISNYRKAKYSREAAVYVADLLNSQISALS